MRIGIDVEKLLEIANSLKARKEDFESLVSQMGTEINKIPDAWDGDSATAYLEQYESLQPSFNNIAEVIETISIQITDVVNANETLDSDVKNILKQGQ